VRHVRRLVSRRRPAPENPELAGVQARIDAVQTFLTDARGSILSAESELREARTLLDATASLYRSPSK
jgi:hypothetical protein